MYVGKYSSFSNGLCLQGQSGYIRFSGLNWNHLWEGVSKHGYLVGGRLMWVKV